MLKVLFFARVKEQLDCAGLDLEWHENLRSFSGLESQLFKLKGEPWAAVLAEENIIRALNQTVVEVDARICDGDEVAYFPPVTGG
ncbi:MAG: MoaD/ThiS family protein [Halioglobus sp.]